jgi:pyruvate,water dikinase
MRFILAPPQVSEKGLAGGKAYALGRLHEAVGNIPGWFVITPAAFHASLNETQRKILQTADFDFDDLGPIEPCDALREEVAAALIRICPGGEPVAVRSSAVEEDSASASFAGQLESFLQVPHDDILSRVVDVWRSGFSQRVREYRRNKNLAGQPAVPAVLVQKMVKSEVSGVAFSSNPVTGGRDECVVSSVRGLGDRLVAGEVAGDVFHVSRADVVTTQAIGDESPCLSKDQVLAVAQLAKKAEGFFGSPQDIEWAIADGELFLLQSRPITTLPEDRPKDGAVILWDNSNIVESYSGVTSPLTFSFARHVYEGVYRQFVAILGVGEKTVEQNADLFRNMLGLVQGRVYYNLLNWYRLIAMLPGFSINRRLMEQMLGVSRTLPPAFVERLAPADVPLATKVRALPAFTRSLVQIVIRGIQLPKTIARFYERLDSALATPVAELEAMRLDELGAYYRHLERSLLHHWDAPVLNDFFCMIFFGVSREALKKWSGNRGEALHGEFLREQGGIVSTEPARRIKEMAAIAAKNPELVESLLSGGRERCFVAIDHDTAFKEKYSAYMERFGDRCVQELKLESPTLYDEPIMLLRTIGELAATPREPVVQPTPARDPADALNALMRGRPLRFLVARGLLRQAKRRVQNRENLRFERTRVFGRARRIFIEIGKRCTDAGILADPRDIFFLEINEILGSIEGTATSQDLKGLAMVRKAERDRFMALPDPPNRFETYGAVILSDISAVSNPQAEEPASLETERHGLASSPGVVRGTARVVRDPKGQSIRPGEILVARHTDPGWVLLFTNAAGVIVERGSLLSHSAIVARELGIPSVVSVPGLTEWLKDGDLIELDGTHGIVKRISDEQR